MGKLYAFLATLMFMVFVFITSSLLLNKKIDETTAIANTKLEEYAGNIATKLNANQNIENAKFRHKAYFANCFPNVCAKFSFASLAFTEKSLSTQTGLIEKNTVKYDLGTTAYFVVKYNPITGNIFVEQNANNIILNKNNEKYATVFFNKLNFDISADLIDYYSNLYSGNVDLFRLVDKLLGSIELHVDGFKLSVDDYRFKSDVLDYKSDIVKNDEKHISLESSLNLKGLLTSQTNITTDSNVDFKLENLSKKSLIEAFKLTNTQQSPEHETISYMKYLLDFVKTLATENTKVEFNNVDLKLYKALQDNLLVLSAKGDLAAALDADFNPNANLHFMLKTQEQDIEQLLQEIKFPLRVNKQLVNLFEKDDSNVYHTTIKAEDKQLVVNENSPANIDGLIKKYIQTGELLLNIAVMKLANSNF